MICTALFLTNSFKDYKEEFIKILLHAEDDKEQKIAMRLFMLGNKHISVLVSESDELKDYAASLNNDSDYHVICNIIETCVNNFPNCISAALSFVPSLIKFAFSYQIISMFENLFELNDDLIVVHKYFSNINFINSIIELYDQVDELTKYGLLKIAFAVLLNPAIVDTYDQAKLIDILKKSINCDSTRVKSMSWSLVLVLSKPYIMSLADQIQFIEEAVTNVCIKDQSGFLEYQVNALQCLSALLSNIHNEVTYLDLSAVISRLLEVYTDYPGHSIAFQAIFNFILLIINIPRYRNLVIDTFIPEVITISKESTSKTQVSFANDFMSKLSTQVFNDDSYKKEIPDEIYQYLATYKVDSGLFTAYLHPPITDFPEDLIDEVLFVGF